MELRQIALGLCVAVVLCSCSKQDDQARKNVERGKGLIDAEQYDEAIRLFTKAIETDPQYADAYLQLALLYDDHLNDTTNAVAAYQRFIAVTTDADAKEKAEEWLAMARNRGGEFQGDVLETEPVTADAGVQAELRRKERQFEMLRKQMATRYEDELNALKTQAEDMKARMAAIERENRVFRGMSGNTDRVVMLDMMTSNKQVIASLTAALEAQGRNMAATTAAYAALQLQATALQKELARATSGVPAIVSALVTGEAALLAATGTPVRTAGTAMAGRAPVPSTSRTVTTTPSTKPEPVRSGTSAPRTTPPSTSAPPSRAYSEKPVAAPSRTYPETPVTPTPSAGAAAGAGATGGRRTYVVQQGDSLMKIARAVYGDPNKWTVLYDGNRDTLARPNQLKVGQTLRVPALPR